MADVLIGNKRVRLDPSLLLGQGGEAEVYDIGGVACKIFKPPSHPDFAGSPDDKAGALDRIKTHQMKLPAFPKNVPSRVIAPQELVRDASGKQIVGYTMKKVGGEVLFSYADKSFRQSGIDHNMVVGVFRDFHSTLRELHNLPGGGVVVGDNNDLNVLVDGTAAYLIDADSFQYGSFLCKVFTARFVDPTLCDPKQKSLMLVKPHNANSDWYAFAIMLFQCFLFINPYAGVYRPKDPKKRISIDERPLHRITVFEPDVIYPKQAIPYTMLPDDLLHYYHRLLKEDARDEFPLRLLDACRWTKCDSCGAIHARTQCPECNVAAPAAIKEVTTVRGRVTARRVFQTKGTILYATSQKGKLRWLYHEGNSFRREDDSVVISGVLDPRMRYRISGDRTFLAKQGTLVTCEPGKSPERANVDHYQALPVFDANDRGVYWAQGGQLVREGILAPDIVAPILRGQTLFWAGPAFGFGFYRAGQLTVSFIFDRDQHGINDSVKVTSIKGQLIDASCAFTHERCWFFHAIQQGGKIIHTCTVIRRDGTIEATAQAEAQDESWLGTIRGKFATGASLFSATNDGIVRVDVENGVIVEKTQFPDTATFVDSTTQLFPGTNGLYAVSGKEVVLLEIK